MRPDSPVALANGGRDMTGRLPWLPLDQSLALAAELGATGSQANRGAFRMLAHNPQLAGKVYGLLNALMQTPTLPLRLREIAVLRIAWLTGSEYQWGQHYRIATEQAGLSDEDVLAVRRGAASPRFSRRDRAVLKAVDDSIGAHGISDDTWRACAMALNDRALVELVVAIGTWTMFSQIFRSLDVPLPDDSTPWPPDGFAP